MEDGEKVLTTEEPVPRTVRARPRFKADAWFVATLCLASALRVIYALRPHICFGDESFYLMLAQNLFSGEGYTYYCGLPEVHFPPLFPIVLGLLNLVVNDWEVVSRVAYVLFGTLQLFPVYLLARAAHGLNPARIAAFLLALLPALTSGVLFAETLSEPLYLLCLFSGIYQLYRCFVGSGWGSYAGAGVAFGLAYLTRPEGYLYVILSFVLLTFWRLIVQRGPRWKSVREPAILVAGFLLVASPYLVYVRAVVGDWTLTTKGTTTYQTTRALVDKDGASFQQETWGLNDEGEVRFYERKFDPGTLELLVGPYRHRVLPDILANTRSAKRVLYRFSFCGRNLLVIACFGFLLTLWPRKQRWSSLFHVAMLLPLAVFLVFFIQERYLYPLLLPLVLWSAYGLEQVRSWAAAVGSRPWIRVGVQWALFLTLGTYLLLIGHRVFAQHKRVEPDFRDLTAALKASTPEDAIVVSPYPHFAFHASRKWLPLPWAPLEEVLDYALKRKATHLVLARRRIENRPEWQQKLLYTPQEMPGICLISASAQDPQKAYALYSLTGVTR